jgi:Ca2+-binding EF-hand superfamily protein
MKKLLVTIALGASFVSAPALAQQGAGGGYMQRDQTRAEAQQRADMMFQVLDTNKKGVVTRAEAQQALTQFLAARGGDNEDRGASRMQRMLDSAFGTAQSLTLQQFETQALARFDAMDLNHDGVVTAAERQQARAQRQAQGAAPAAPQAAPTPAAPAKPQ